MRGKWIYRFLIFVGACLIIGFTVWVCVDVFRYEMYAVPIGWLVVFRFFEFLFPGVFLTITGILLRRKIVKKKKTERLG